MPGVRCDIASLGSGWNDTMIWYAKAIQALSRPGPNVRTSWTYLAAIHGIDYQGWVADGVISQQDPLPPQPEQDDVWNQCQHAGWFFLPWHRGYVAAFEAIVSAAVQGLGGPSDWALPYWNYLNDADPNSRHMPQVFLDVTMPDGTPNPLAKARRGGTTVLGPQPWLPRDITLACMGYDRYTAAAGTTEFGGGATGFMHFGSQAGAVELNPHNLVHVMVGGVGPTAGFMSDPDYAALDPVFWVHHCNVDRLWAAWLTQPGNVQETGSAFTTGPFPRNFMMPDPSGHLNGFTPGETLPGGALAPTYDNLTAGTGVGGGAVLASVGGGAVPASVDAEKPEENMVASSSEEPPTDAAVVGSNKETLQVGPGATAAATTTVQIAPQEAQLASDAGEHRLFLNLENVRGAAPSGVLSVFMTVPTDGAVPASAPEYVDTVALFGLAKASAGDGSHGGNGLTFALDITDISRRLAQASQETLDRVEVRIEQAGATAEHPITVERVSVYRQPIGGN